MCTCTQEADAKGHLVTHCNALGVSPCALVSRNMEDSENMAFAPFATRSASLPIGHAPGLSTTVAVCHDAMHAKISSIVRATCSVCALVWRAAHMTCGQTKTRRRGKT